MLEKRNRLQKFWNETVLGYLEQHLPRFVSERIADSRRKGWQKFYDRIRKENAVMHVNDCADDDSRARLIGRSDALIGRSAGFIGVSTDLEESAGIITALDALTGAGHQRSTHDNVVLANTAPRNGEGKKHENGSPFGYFWDQKGHALVVATVGGYALSLPKKFGRTDRYFLLDTRRALQVLRKAGMISDEEQERIAETQFRSFEFSPRIAAYLLRYGSMHGAEKKGIDEVPDAPQGAVWLVDKFATYGNCKTTLLPQDVFDSKVLAKLKDGAPVEFEVGADGKKRHTPITHLTIKTRAVPVYRHLSHVQDGELAVVVGSSGLGEDRFLEIVLQGGNAAEHLGIKQGDSIL